MSDPLWIGFDNTGTGLNLRLLPDGVVNFDVIATTGAGVSVLVLGGNASLAACDMTLNEDGQVMLGLGLCVVPLVNDPETIQAVARHLGITPPPLDPSRHAPQQRMLA